MWMNKIRQGVLAVQTESGLRYIQPSLMQRIRLVWTFRNFHVLPEEVLQRHELALIDSLCRKGKYVANWNGHGDLAEFRIGTIERLNQGKPVSPAPASAEDRRPPRATPTVLPRAS
jgi:hypothetical protein